MEGVAIGHSPEAQRRGQAVSARLKYCDPQGARPTNNCNNIVIAYSFAQLKMTSCQYNFVFFAIFARQKCVNRTPKLV
jgi:hypothetical protein